MWPSTVFLVLHHHYSERFLAGRDDKVIGAFSDRELAEAAIRDTRELEGFREHSTEFEVIELPMDETLPGPGVEFRE